VPLPDDRWRSGTRTPSRGVGAENLVRPRLQSGACDLPHNFTVLGVFMAYPKDFDDLLPANKEEFARLPHKTQVARCIHMLEAEVNNGGFHQFFLNSSGEYVPETLSALAEIGATQTRDLVKRATTVAFPGGYPADPADHRTSLAAFDEVADALDLLDTEFYRYVEPLADLVNGYLDRDP
jgi:Domain of unknown function (DUF4375)